MGWKIHLNRMRWEGQVPKGKELSVRGEGIQQGKNNRSPLQWSLRQFTITGSLKTGAPQNSVMGIRKRCIYIGRSMYPINNLLICTYYSLHLPISFFLLSYTKPKGYGCSMFKPCQLPWHWSSSNYSWIVLPDLFGQRKIVYIILK